MKVKLVLVLMLALLFTACGSHKSGTNDIKTNSTQDDVNKSVGYYTDSGIVGVDYACGVLSGETGKDGMFYYEKDKGCVFSFAGIILKEVSADDLLKDSVVVEMNTNIGRMLQILDNDGNSTNDLTMTDSVEAQLKSAGITQVPSTEDEFKKLFEAAKLASGYDGKFITNQEAIDHMHEGVIDNTPPVISLRGADKVTVNFGDKYTDIGATASDDVDGDLSHKIKITGTVDTHNEGNYTISFNVADTAGNEAVEVKRTVIVKRIEPVEDASLASSFFVRSSSRNRILSVLRMKSILSISLSKDRTKAYLVDLNKGLRIVDITDAKNPTQIGLYDASSLMSVTLSSDGTKAYVGDYYKGMKIIDITNPNNPILLGSLDINVSNPYAYSVEVSSIALSNDGTKAYISVRHDGMKIVDITDANNPTLLGSFDTEYGAKFVTLSKDGTKAYLVDWDKGLKIVDITDANNPMLLGSLDTYSPESITLSSDGTKVYIADGAKGIKIIDVTNPNNPTLLGSLDTDNWTRAITLSNDGTKAYLADGEYYIEVIDITVDNNPTLFGSFYIGNYDGTATSSIALSKDDSKAYVACDQGGMKIVDLVSSLVIKYIDFGNGTINLTFLKNIGDVEISITTDRDDIITLGDYAKTFSPNSANGYQYKIPVSSLSGAKGTTIFTIKVKKDGKVGTKEVPVIVEHEPV